MRNKVVLGGNWLLVPEFWGPLVGAAEYFNETFFDDREVKANDERSIVTYDENFATIAIDGPLAQDWPEIFRMLLGATSYREINSNLLEAASRPEIEAILLDFNTPGGNYTGLPELRAQIKEIAEEKPVFAFTDTMAASAGYYLATGASEIFASPSAETGSVGVFSAFLDSSKAMGAEGLEWKIFRSGDLKGAFLPGTSLTEKQSSYLQDSVDAIMTDFVGVVKESRKTFDDNILDGRILTGNQALSAGLIDGLATRNEIISTISK